MTEVGIPTTVAFRPSIIDGDRAESRLGEQAGLVVMRALAPVLGRLRPTRADDIALAMLAVAKAPPAGVCVLSAAEITRTLADLGAPSAADIVSLRVWTRSGHPRT